MAVEPLVCTVGDLVEDVIARTARPPVRGADVPATVTRHRGGSAANTAAAVARLGGRARFIGRVGDDDAGHRLLGELRGLGVECPVEARGTTGTVVVVVEPDGERTMLSDRRSAADLGEYDEAWLGGAAALHVTNYALRQPPLADIALRLLYAARRRDLCVSLDPSAVPMIDERFRAIVRDVRPDVVLCDAAEADALGVAEAGIPGARIVVVKRAGEPILLRGEVTASVPAGRVQHPVDTTGAGDAFAGAFLLQWLRTADAVEAAEAGHRAAMRVVQGIGADAWS